MDDTIKTIDSSHHDLYNAFTGDLKAANDLKAIEDLRVGYFGKSGRLTSLLKTLGTMSGDERKVAGAALNVLKTTLTQSLESARALIEEKTLTARLETERLDVTLPSRPAQEGLLHPLTRVMEQALHIFGQMGFTVEEGPDIEDEEHNFSALNIPEDHPARQEHDTFYLPGSHEGGRLLLRTHTSPVQIRTMRTQKPPIRIIVPGRTYRSDYDATHAPMFHQIEGLVVDRAIHMGHLKGCLEEFFRLFFNVPNLPIRFRPSYFPFTEPSAEVDMGCRRTAGHIEIGDFGDWLEIGGCGMVHPQVLRNCGLDPDEFQGFAFGMGLERMAMLKFGIPDLRDMVMSDNRWLKHYGFTANAQGF